VHSDVFCPTFDVFVHFLKNCGGKVRREFGVKDLNEIFRSIEEEALGAATIGQVHGLISFSMIENLGIIIVCVVCVQVLSCWMEREL
jgi:hypothetical protein